MSKENSILLIMSVDIVQITQTLIDFRDVDSSWFFDL